MRGVLKMVSIIATAVAVVLALCGFGSTGILFVASGPIIAGAAVFEPRAVVKALPMPPSASVVVGKTANTTGKHVALTFDDGPDPKWTPEVLRLLEQYGARATFCVVGERVRAHPDVVRRVVAAGHALCDHTETHDGQLAKRKHATQLAEIHKGKQAILDAVPDAQVLYFRAPQGSFSKENQELAVSLGMQPVGWSIDTLDWTKPGTDRIVTSVTGKIGDNDVILFHDGGGNRAQTIEALTRLLPWLVNQGYQFDIPA
jgi:peptidoglycan/xylan/chitin deacetylase (PgdA/CDA1 family)